MLEGPNKYPGDSLQLGGKVGKMSIRVKFNLTPEWAKFEKAMSRLTSKQARLALAIATTKTAKVIGEKANREFQSKEFDKTVSVKVRRMARPGSLMSTVGFKKVRQFNAVRPRRIKLTGPALKGFMAELARTGEPIRTRERSILRTGKMLAHMRLDYNTPQQALRDGCFLMATRTGAYKKSAASRGGKALMLIAHRLTVRRLPIEAVARVYDIPRRDLSTIALAVGPAAFDYWMTKTLTDALHKAAG